jgi:hypothetical protein
VNCPFALDQGRYTWRHDSVLFDIEITLSKLIETFNSKKPSCFSEFAKSVYTSSFVHTGEPKKKSKRAEMVRSLLEDANDWKLQVDFEERNLVFPPTICVSNLKPDIVI